MTELSSKILINVEDDETRIALLNGNNLENLHIEQTERTQKIGNIYLGKVVKIQTSFQAAFVNYGEERDGFLSISDINFQVYKPTRGGRGRTSISQVLKIGQKVLVQVIKDEIAHKGASLTTNISIAGRFLVFMPDSDRGGVSKKIEDEEQRTRLRHLLKGLGDENSSAIIRTVGVDRSLTELKRDYTVLRRTWVDIKNDFESESTPKLLFQEEDAMLRMIRDYFNDSVMEVVIDEPVSFQRALEFFQTFLPKEQKKLKLYLGEKSLFASHGIENQIETLQHQEVPLPSGGSLVIMPTEALVAIDVNSGKSSQEKNIENTALRTNLEAAEEISRQLRLRNLGGLVVIDFIDMDNSKNRLLVEQKIEESMVFDKAKTSFGLISKFGLLELSRQRISSSLSNKSNLITLANRILRKIHDTAITNKLLEVSMRLPIELASHILNIKRQKLNQMEMDYGFRINIVPDMQLAPQEIDEMKITIQDNGHSETEMSIPISEIIADKHNFRKEQFKKNDEKNLNLNLENKNLMVDAKDLNETKKELKNSDPTKKSKIDKKTENKKQKTGPQNDNKIEKIDVEKLPGDILEKEDLETLDDNISGTIFESHHEKVDKETYLKNISDPTNKSVDSDENNKLTNFNSIHLGNNEKNQKNKELIEEDNLNNNFSETTSLYSSIHLNDFEKQTANLPKRTKQTKLKNLKDSLPESKSETSKPRKSKAKKTFNKKDDSLISNSKDNKTSIKKSFTKKTSREIINENNKVSTKNIVKGEISKNLNNNKVKKNYSKSDTKQKEIKKTSKTKSDTKKKSDKNPKTKNSAA